MQISGSTALVTGATGGIGQAIARDLRARGAELILTGRRTDVLEPLASELGARAIASDLSDAAAAEHLLAEAGPVDILIANAALPGAGRLDTFSVEQVDRALDVNLRAPVMMARLLVPALVERGSGHLLFVSSLSGKATAPESSLYSATKFGLRGFALALRAELHGSGVGVSVICPGFIREAGMFADAEVKLPTGVGTRSPQDVARAVVRAIERNRAEIDVAPFSLRAGAAFANVAPGIAASVTRRTGGNEIASALAVGHGEAKR